MPTRIHRTSVSPLDPETVAGWARVPTTIVTDLFRGRTLVDPAIRPLRPFAGGGRLDAAMIGELLSAPPD